MTSKLLQEQDPRMQDDLSESSESDGVSSSTESTGTGRTPNEESTKQEQFTQKETKLVNRSKLAVYFVLFLAAAAVGGLTYWFISQGEKQDYQSEFISMSGEISTMANANARAIISQLNAMSTTITSFALSTNMTFPFVTMPNYDRRALDAEEATGLDMIIFAPIVTNARREQWEQYAWDNQGWIKDNLKYRGMADKYIPPISKTIYPFNESMNVQIWEPEWGEAYDKEHGDDHGDEHRRRLSLTSGAEWLEGQEYTAPLWQMGPNFDASYLLNLDLNSNPDFEGRIERVLMEGQTLLSGVTDLTFVLNHNNESHHHDGEPRSFIVQPVFDDFYESSRVVAFLFGVIRWDLFLVNILPEGTPTLNVVVVGTCGGTFHYEINGRDAHFLGSGDLPPSKFTRTMQVYDFASFASYEGDHEGLEGIDCRYQIQILATAEFEESYLTNAPILYTLVVVLVFLFTAGVFVLYDWLVQRRQTKLLRTAQRTNAIVSSLFPKDVQQRIMADAEKQAQKELNEKASGFDGFITDSPASLALNTRPIADLFPEVTIMFADIVGFTAWSSMREPSQVFTLLESIFHEYDTIAKRRRVFKVETVGDCYVAVAGLPNPRKDHAVVMARFATDCLMRMNALIEQLSTTLGPDTTDLGMRFGLHSGPVTAGVLRGEKARFQLFGDTMNTTARIETTGQKNKIHVSQETGDLLIAAGKGHWLRDREDKVHAKGKGELTTYWLNVKSSDGQSSSGSSDKDASEYDAHVDVAKYAEVKEAKPDQNENVAEDGGFLPQKHLRLVDWNAEILAKILREVVVRRESSGIAPSSVAELRKAETDLLHSGKIVIEEVEEVIALPEFNAQAAKNARDSTDVDLGDAVMEQLRDYVRTLAAMYRDNPFHNFEHASHVTMSVVKLLSRIVAPQIKMEDVDNKDKAMHDHTYGITSDPLTQFAVILSALIHDVDHTGVPNNQLVKEQASIAAVYKDKSVAEQNSVDIAWDLLMQEGYQDLRGVIYSTVDEFKRFRQLIVNTVMATDIMDKELSAARKARWNKAFSGVPTDVDSCSKVAVDRKATIVIEHLIQASDVAHTMQHFHIYRKWNGRLFEEMYKAYKEGRAEKDPSENWYQGEIGFFDFYIIPLAKKLKDCGVFGVSSDEYLNYAQQNRKIWESKGQEIVAELIRKATL